jgi:3-phenylpropionate/cinnamic acid dioxygenase small subunit
LNPVSSDVRDAVEQFLIHESALLDDADWNGWQELYASDGTYWMPLDRAQTDAINHVSLIYDDRALMHLRCKRLADATDVSSLSLHPFPRVLRFLSNISVQEHAGGPLEARALLLAVHHAAGLTQHLHGRVRWILTGALGRWKILQKRVDLLAADAPLRDILVYL